MMQSQIIWTTHLPYSVNNDFSKLNKTKISCEYILKENVIQFFVLKHLVKFTSNLCENSFLVIFFSLYSLPERNDFRLFVGDC